MLKLHSSAMHVIQQLFNEQQIKKNDWKIFLDVRSITTNQEFSLHVAMSRSVTPFFALAALE